MSKGLPRSRSRGAPQTGGVRRQRVAFTNKAVSVAGTTGVGFGTAVIGDLPVGNILFLGAVSYVSLAGSGSDANLVATWNGDYSIGSAANGDTSLSGAEVDIIPSTSTTVAVAEVSPTTRGANATQAMLDNTDGSLEINLNVLVDDADISGTVTMTATGYVDIAYIVLSDD